MEENKAAFVDALGYALHKYTRLGIGTVIYNKTPDDRELVEILFLNGGIIRVEVTADSCIAIMQDIYKALS